MEGLDELAERAGIVEQLRPITDAAMAGTISFDNAYAERLSLLQPDRDAVEWLAQRYRQTLLDDAGELIAALQARGKAVHVISGGIREALLGLAGPLGLPEDRIHAVGLMFDEHGHYTGYDRHSPLCRQHGKAAVCHELIPHGTTAVLIGDGITDYEAIESGIDFIGFGGVVRRPSIEQRAAVYHADAELLGLLPRLLTAAELEGLAVRK